MGVSIVVAMDRNNLIGNKGALPWGHLPADMRHFKDLTLNHFVVMGRKTFQSIGRPLPRRTNLVLTRDESSKFEEPCTVYNELKCLKRTVCELSQSKEVFVIGGGEVYSHFLSVVDYIYLSRIEGEFEGDTYFPKIQIEGPKWEPVKTFCKPVDKKNAHAITFTTYRRRT